MQVQTARKTVVIDLTSEIETKDEGPSQTKDEVPSLSDLQQSTKETQTTLRRSDRKKKYPRERDLPTTPPITEKKVKKKRKYVHKQLKQKIRMGHASAQNSQTLSQCLSILESLSNQDLLELATSIQLVLQSRNKEDLLLDGIFSSQNKKSDTEMNGKKQRKRGKKSNSSSNQKTRRVSDTHERPSAVSLDDVPEDWPKELNVQYTNLLLWDRVASGHQRLRWQLSHKMRCRDQQKRPFQIRKVTNPAHPCFGQHGLFATHSIRKGDLLPDYAGRVLISHCINGKSATSIVRDIYFFCMFYRIKMMFMKKAMKVIANIR